MYGKSLRLKHALLGAAALGLVSIQPAAAAKLVVYGTDRVGSIVNVTGGIIAKLISQKSTLTARLQSFAGPEAWLPELDSGRISFGSHFAASFYLAFNQVDTKLHTKDVRVIRSSRGTSLLGFMVRKDSDIKSIRDLKGKRVTSGYGGQPVIRVLSEASMMAYGVSPSDVKPVPTVAVVGGVEALVSGRADAAWASPMMPQAREANAKIGIRFLPMNDLTAEQEAQIRSTAVYAYADTFKGNMPFFPKGTKMMTQEMYVSTSKHTSDEAVRTATEALWNHSEELRKAHPALRGFLNKAAVSPRVEIPYHPAAIAFYKEKGVWSAEAEAVQQKLLKKAM